MNVLFVTWDGPQVSYLEGLFLPIFHRLALRGWDFHVLQFTWRDRQRQQISCQACAEAGLPYRSVFVWRRPVSLGALATAVKGARDIHRAVREWDIDVVMPRSVLPVFSSMLALRREPIPMVFDADGLPLDERVEFGNMSSSDVFYRLLRDIEAEGVRRADAILTRTNRAADILLARAGASTPPERFFLVGNGRDTDEFALMDSKRRASFRAQLGISSDAPLLVYVGSLGGQYCLRDMLALFSKILQRRPDARFLILSGSPCLARSEIAGYANVEDKIIIDSVSSGDVPGYLAAADLGLALRKPSFSMQAVAPIKLGEYLLCGLPVVATVGVGDTSGISPDVGRLISHHDVYNLNDVACWFTDTVLPARERFRASCRKAGVEHFSLESTVDSYLEALNTVRP